MPTLKTEATELSVGFGVLGFSNPIGIHDQISTLFTGSLPQTKYLQFEIEFANHNQLYQQFINIGLSLGRQFLNNPNNIIWSGPELQAATSAGAKDLFVPTSNMPISVKNESNVVANPSPHNIFRSLSSGMTVASQAEDWFIEKDHPGLQALYTFIRLIYDPDLPDDIIEFYRRNGRPQRKALQAFLSNGLSASEQASFTERYIQVCRTVAQRSAGEFNSNLAGLRSNIRSSVYETLIKQFFRIDTVPYILAGIDNNREFAVRIPDLTSWKRGWIFHRIEALPDLTRGQSVVYIDLDLQNRQTNQIHHLRFHVEIRWSHGKFCGNPEAKLYKEFHWSDVPFFDVLI